jgi:hypothetical protein
MTDFAIPDYHDFFSSVDSTIRQLRGADQHEFRYHMAGQRTADPIRDTAKGFVGTSSRAGDDQLVSHQPAQHFALSRRARHHTDDQGRDWPRTQRRVYR